MVIAAGSSPEAIVVYASDGALRILGAEREACIGRELLASLPSQLFQGHARSTLQSAIEQRQPCSIRARRRDAAGGDVDSRVSLIPVDPTAGAAFFVVTFERSSDSAQSDLGHAAEREDAIAHLMSHELRSPLNSALTWVSLLEVDRSARTIERVIHVVKQSIRDQARLIDDLLDVVRARRHHAGWETRPLDLAALLLDVVSARDEELPDGMELTHHVDAGSYVVDGDEGRLRRAIRHLLDNAVKFTPGAGGRVDVRLFELAGFAVIEVTDTGIGLTPEETRVAFEPFWRARSDRPGGGLGLGFIDAVVSQHGGTVSVRSRGPGSGSAFAVALPLVTNQPGR